MVTKRIIPCLDCKDGRVVKGIQFQGLTDAGSPPELAARYQIEGADELVLLDVRNGSLVSLNRVARALRRSLLRMCGCQSAPSSALPDITHRYFRRGRPSRSTSGLTSAFGASSQALRQFPKHLWHNCETVWQPPVLGESERCSSRRSLQNCFPISAHARPASFEASRRKKPMPLCGGCLASGRSRHFA